jgi:anti-anti-sigma factor
MDLDLNVRTEGEFAVLEVGGEIDVYTAPKLREKLIELVSDGAYHLIVDLEKVDFLDSTGRSSSAGSSGSATTTARSNWCAPRRRSSRSSASPA